MWLRRFLATTATVTCFLTIGASAVSAQGTEEDDIERLMELNPGASRAEIIDSASQIAQIESRSTEDVIRDFLEGEEASLKEKVSCKALNNWIVQ